MCDAGMCDARIKGSQTALNNASGQRREMRAIARKKLEPTGGLFKNGLHLYGVSL